MKNNAHRYLQRKNSIIIRYRLPGFDIDVSECVTPCTYLADVHTNSYKEGKLSKPSFLAMLLLEPEPKLLGPWQLPSAAIMNS